MPAIYIDCSMTCKLQINTGIQRVVRNIARHATETPHPTGYAIRLVNMRDGEFSEITLEEFQPTKVEATGRQRLHLTLLPALMTWADRLRYALVRLIPAAGWHRFIYAPYYHFGLAYCVLLPFQPLLRMRARRNARAYPRAWSDTTDLSGDILLLPDSTWEFDVWPIVARFKHQGGYVAAVIHDLIPILHPQFCVVSHTKIFARWIRQSVRHVDFYICNSRSTQATLDQFLQDLQIDTPTGFFHLGSDLDLAHAAGTPRPLVSDIIADGSPLFLTVGSLEPRKNIGFVLDAFDVIWSRNSDVKLVLVGHRTWKVDDLISRIERHPQHGKRLFWLRDATDNDLGFLYQQAHALVFASCVEGFGLPLVEAMQRGLPVLCSDIPVFREIADGKVRFFSLAAKDELVAAVLDTAREQADPGRAERGTFRWMNWQESTEQLLNKVLAEHSLRHKANAPNCPASSAKRTSSQHRS